MKNYLLIFFIAIILGSCETDFDTSAPWKEVMVVYGMVNPNDAVQYIDFRAKRERGTDGV